MSIQQIGFTTWVRRSRPAVAGLAALGILVTGCVRVNDTVRVEISNTSQTAKTIVLINPNSNADATTSMVDLANTAIGGTALVTGVTNDGAPALLTTAQDMETAAQGVVQRGVTAAKDPNVGAIIVSAFSDPGLDELRAAVDIPVFGIGEEAFRQAAEGGRQFGIATVTPDPALIESFRQKAASMGYEELYRGVRVTSGDPTQLVKSPDELDAALAEAVQQSVALDGAKAVIMGGGPLSASALRIQPKFDVPLVVAVNAAAKAAMRGVEEHE